MTRLAPALVLGTDSPIGLTVVRELGRHGVPVHAIGGRRSLARVSAFSQRHVVRPRGPIASWLPALVERTRARALLAVSEGDLLELAGLPEWIGGCHILTPRAGPLRDVLDKRATLRRAAALGMSVPASWQPRADEDRAAHAATLRFPLIAKWADPGEAARRLAPFGLAPLKSEYLADADALGAMLRRYDAVGEWPLVQSYCAGIGLGQMLFMDRGEPVLRFQHRRLREWPPEGGISTCCAAEPFEAHEAQMTRSAELLRALGWQGPAMVEYRYDAATGTYWLMEINGRFWGSLPLASQSGAQFAWEAYRRAVLGDSAPAPAPRMDLRARFLVPDTRRLARMLFAAAAISDPALVVEPLREIARYVADFADPAMRYYVAALDDPLPLLADALAMLRKLLPDRAARARVEGERTANEGIARSA